MLGIEHYWLFVVSALILNMTPGTDTLYILGRTVSQGRSAGLLSVAGITAGSCAHTLFAVCGLSVILMNSAIAFSAVKWLGAAYLVYMGIRTWIGGGVSGQKEAEGETGSHGRIFVNGLLTNLLNPKVALFYLAFMPQFISPANGYGPLPFLLLGLTFIATGTLWCAALVMFSERASRRLRASSRISLIMNRCAGLLFIGLGIKMLLTRRASA